MERLLESMAVVAVFGIVAVVVWLTIGRTMMRVAPLASEAPVGRAEQVRENEPGVTYVVRGCARYGNDLLVALAVAEGRPVSGGERVVVLPGVAHDARALRLLDEWERGATRLVTVTTIDDRGPGLYDLATGEGVLVTWARTPFADVARREL
jgi:hypothetical protein